MADSSVQCDSISHTLSEPTGNIYDLNFIKCSEYESQLCEVLNELGSAQKIIEILQQELSIYSPNNNVCGNALVQSKVSSKPVNSSEWTLAPARNLFQNQSISNKHSNVNSAQTIRTENRFSLLSNLEVDSMILHRPYEQRKPSPLQTALDTKDHYNIGINNTDNNYRTSKLQGKQEANVSQEKEDSLCRWFKLKY